MVHSRGPLARRPATRTGISRSAFTPHSSSTAARIGGRSPGPDQRLIAPVLTPPPSRCRSGPALAAWPCRQLILDDGTSEARAFHGPHRQAPLPVPVHGKSARLSQDHAHAHLPDSLPAGIGRPGPGLQPPSRPLNPMCGSERQVWLTGSCTDQAARQPWPHSATRSGRESGQGHAYRQYRYRPPAGAGLAAPRCQGVARRGRDPPSGRLVTRHGQVPAQPSDESRHDHPPQQHELGGIAPAWSGLPATRTGRCTTVSLNPSVGTTSAVRVPGEPGNVRPAWAGSCRRAGCGAEQACRAGGMLHACWPARRRRPWRSFRAPDRCRSYPRSRRCAAA